MNKWINDIRHRFEGHTQEPPKGLLDDIKVEMVRRGLVSASPSVSSHVGKSPKWWAAAAAVAVIIAGVGVWWLRSSAPETNALVSQQQPKETAKQGQRDAETLTLHENVPQTTMSWWAKKKNNRVISALGMTETAMASTSENNMVESQAVVNSTDSTSQKPTKRPVTKDETYSNPTEILSQRLVSSTPQRLTFDVYMSGRGMSTQAIGNTFNHGIMADVMANPNKNGHYLS
ncbi:MAG: RNA polymerase, partial [Prevotella salivae]|nr:RNA polymerase [Segatella salivae]